MANFSYDIVSEFDKAEMNNAYDGARREIENRYDFKGTPAALEWLGDKTGVVICGNSDWQIEAILDIFHRNLTKRGLTIKFLDLAAPITTNNLQSQQEIPFIEGLDVAKAKTVSRLIRDKFSKAKPQIIGSAVRVSSASKDELQNIMKYLRAAELDFAVGFTNFR
jgi:uncharacterized protein YajQ (UPF0234 family)